MFQPICLFTKYHNDSLPLCILDISFESGLVPSKTEARRLIKQNGLFLNDKAVSDFSYCLQQDDFKNKGIAVIRRGKKTFTGIKLI